jgi:hypothetical protein
MWSSPDVATDAAQLITHLYHINQVIYSRVLFEQQVTVVDLVLLQYSRAASQTDGLNTPDHLIFNQHDGADGPA